MSAPELTLAQAQVLIRRITQDDHEIAQPLFELLMLVVDPGGNEQRFAVADEVMKQVIVMTPKFEEWYRSQFVA